MQMGFKLVLATSLTTFLIYRHTGDPVMLFCALHGLMLAICIICQRVGMLSLPKRSTNRSRTGQAASDS